MTDRNIILNVDSYKASQFLQYPPGTEFITSYGEAQGGPYEEVVFIGMQPFMLEYLVRPITRDNIEEAAQILIAHGEPFNREGWEYILKEHDGYLPVEIQALPEGTVCKPGTPLYQICNTDPKCAWLTSYLETPALRAVWYPTTVATISKKCKGIISEFMMKTAGHTDGIGFKLNDFGKRGVSSFESAGLGGMGHLLSFQGSDNLAAIMDARRFYGAEMAGFSIPAAEHSTITSWGRDGETEAYRNMIKQFGGPGKLFAMPTDSYDHFAALSEKLGTELKTEIEVCGGTLIARPDSGNPVAMVTNTIIKLMDKFGYTTNIKGFKVLPSCIRVIQGDGIDEKSIRRILQRMTHNNLSTENIAFGMGGALLQQCDRDWLKFAMKACEIVVNGEVRDVYKDPVTDSGKRSKRGRQAVVATPFGPEAVRENQLGNQENLFDVVYRDGHILTSHTWSSVVERASW